MWLQNFKEDTSHKSSTIHDPSQNDMLRRYGWNPSFIDINGLLLVFQKGTSCTDIRITVPKLQYTHDLTSSVPMIMLYYIPSFLARHALIGVLSWPAKICVGLSSTVCIGDSVRSWLKCNQIMVNIHWGNIPTWNAGNSTLSRRGRPSR